MVNRVIVATLSATALFLVGCGSHAQPGTGPVDEIPYGLYQDFSLDIPNEISKKIRRADASEAFINYDNTIAERKSTDFSIWIFPPNSLTATSSCSPSLTGASKTSDIEGVGTRTEWGRVDAYDIQGNPPDDSVLCRPPEVGWVNDSQGQRPLAYSYALCSEKNGKTVVVCVGQMTDNPELAKQIFETFKWTE